MLFWNYEIKICWRQIRIINHIIICHSDRQEQDCNKRKDGIQLQIYNLGENQIPVEQHSDFKRDSDHFTPLIGQHHYKVLVSRQTSIEENILPLAGWLSLYLKYGTPGKTTIVALHESSKLSYLIFYLFFHDF